MDVSLRCPHFLNLKMATFSQHRRHWVLQSHFHSAAVTWAPLLFSILFPISSTYFSLPSLIFLWPRKAVYIPWEENVLMFYCVNLPCMCYASSQALDTSVPFMAGCRILFLFFLLFAPRHWKILDGSISQHCIVGFLPSYFKILCLGSYPISCF